MTLSVRYSYDKNNYHDSSRCDLSSTKPSTAKRIQDGCALNKIAIF